MTTPLNQLAVFPKGFFDDLAAGRMSLMTWLDLAATLDVNGVELYPRFFQSFDSAYIADVRRALESHGLVMPMMCNSPDFTHPDPDFRRAQIEETKRLLTITAELGGSWCRVLSGQARPGLDETQALGWVVESLETLVPFAERAGVVMTIENHYKDGLWEYPEWAQSSSRYLAILDGVRTPWLAAQYDPSNAIVAGEDAYDLLDQVFPRLATMQASDRYFEGGSLEELRRLDRDPAHGYARFIKHGVIGQGLNDYDRIFSRMAKGGYTGWVSIEDGDGATIEEGMANLRASVAFLRKKIAQHFGSQA